MYISIQLYISSCQYTCLNIDLNVCIYEYIINVYIYIHIEIHSCICTYWHVYIYIYIHVFIYVHMFVCIYAYIYIYTYAYARIWFHMSIYALQYSTTVTTAYTGLIPVVAIPMNQPVFHKISGCHWHAIGHGGHRPRRLLRLSRL